MIEDAAAHAEPGFPRKPTQENGTCTLYSVEARYKGEQPRAFGTVILGSNWKKLEFPPAPIGVPTDTFHPVRVAGCLRYPSAQALRWWFHAEADANFWNYNLETRLVEHKVKYHYDSTAEGAGELVTGRL